MKRYDLLVLGSGPAGHHAAIQGAKLRKSVAVVEAQSRVGGAGLNTGTIPSKTLREVAISVMAARARALAGGHSPEAWDSVVHEMMGRCQQVVQKQVEIYRAQFARNRVELLSGTATFVDPHRVRIESRHHASEVAADTIVIATGTSPARSDKVPVDGHAIVDTDSVPQLHRLPRSMIIVGAGVAGVEYACTFAALGVSVILVDLRPRLLEFVDYEIVEALSYQMRDTGVTLRLGEEVESVALAPGGGVIARMKSRKQLHAETLLYAVGRQGNTTALDLAAAGLQADARGRILVDMNYATAVPHIYAVGDVVGNPGLASVAMEQARLAVCHAFGRPAAFGRHLFPYGIYTIPEISFVGQTEAELTAMGVPYEVGIAQYREIARGQIMGDITGRLKLLFHRETGELLGVHIIGYGAAELIHIGQAVLNHRGSIEYFVENVFNYPTLAECYKVAALAGVNRMAQWATPAAEPALEPPVPAPPR
jgi:NAD(P) transhydrogenase